MSKKLKHPLNFNQTMYICVGDWKDNRKGNCHVDIWTLSYSRKQAKEALLERMSSFYKTWDECEKNGWRCITVTAIITQGN